MEVIHKHKSEKETKTEKQIWENLNIDPKYFTIEDNLLKDGRVIHTIVFHKQPKKEDNVLIMLHGYLGASIIFFKMFKVLMEHFYIVAIDLPGFGSSSRSKKHPSNTEDWISYFLSSVNMTLQKYEIKKANFLGHSLGGFLIGHYLNRFPENVQRVFFLSPGGMNQSTNQKELLMERIKRASCFQKPLLKYGAKKIFETKDSPLEVPGFWMFKSIIVKKIYRSERLNLTKDQQKLFVSLFKRIFNKKRGGDKCLGYFFDYSPKSKTPISKIISKYHKKKDIFLYYGKHDWMDYNDSQNFLTEEKIDIPLQFIEKSDHQIIFQNPYDAAMLVLKDYYNTLKQDEKIEEEKDLFETVKKKLDEDGEYDDIRLSLRKPENFEFKKFK